MDQPVSRKYVSLSHFTREPYSGLPNSLIALGLTGEIPYSEGDPGDRRGFAHIHAHGRKLRCATVYSEVAADPRHHHRCNEKGLGGRPLAQPGRPRQRCCRMKLRSPTDPRASPFPRHREISQQQCTSVGCINSTARCRADRRGRRRVRNDRRRGSGGSRFRRIPQPLGLRRQRAP